MRVFRRVRFIRAIIRVIINVIRNCKGYHSPEDSRAVNLLILSTNMIIRVKVIRGTGFVCYGYWVIY